MQERGHSSPSDHTPPEPGGAGRVREVVVYQSCSPRDRLSILLPVVVNGELSVTGVVDTASQVTVLSEDVYMQLVNPPEVLEHVFLRGAAKDGRFQARKIE